MRQYSDFPCLMRELLQIMKIQPISREEPEVHSFKCGEDVDIHIFSGQRDSIDIVATVGVLQNPKSHEKLQSLLAMNLCIREDSRPFNIGMDPRTGLVSLWTKDYLAFVDANKLVGLIREMLNKVKLIQKQLQERKGSSTSPVISGTNATFDASSKNAAARLMFNRTQK